MFSKELSSNERDADYYFVNREEKWPLFQEVEQHLFIFARRTFKKSLHFLRLRKDFELQKRNGFIFLARSTSTENLECRYKLSSFMKIPHLSWKSISSDSQKLYYFIHLKTIFYKPYSVLVVWLRIMPCQLVLSLQKNS